MIAMHNDKKYIIAEIINNEFIYRNHLSEIHFFAFLKDKCDIILKKNVIHIQEEILPTYSQIVNIVDELKKNNIDNTCFIIRAVTEPIFNLKSIYYRILTNELGVNPDDIHIISTQEIYEKSATNIHIPYFFSSTINMETTNIEKIKKNKLLSSFNRRLNISRSLVVSKIINTFNQDDYEISLNAAGENLHEYYNNIYSNLFYSMGMDLDFYIKKTPIFLDIKNIDNFNMKQYNVLKQAYYCVFDLVNETITNIETDHNTFLLENTFFVSEKSFKPFAAYQIPIFISNYNFYKNFKKMEFDLFEDIIPIDDIDKSFFVENKLKIIFDFLVDFKKNNNYNTFFEKNIDRFNYNYQLLVKYRNQTDVILYNFYKNISHLLLK